jgi:formyl-CoA transferase
MSFTGEEGAERPVAAGVPISDMNAGVFSALGVLAALQSRHATGKGQHVETSLLESALAYTVWETGLYLTTGEVAKPRGTRHRLAAPYEALRTGDGFMVVGVNSNKLWASFCNAIGAPQLISKEGFDQPSRRLRNRDALRDEVEAVLAAEATAYWLVRLEEAGVPAGPRNTLAQAWEDPQVKARGVLTEVGGGRYIRTPIKLHDTPVEIRIGAAEVGQHTREVLAEAGLGKDEIEALIAEGLAAVERKVEA